MWPWDEEGADDRALPRLYHWLLAAVLILGAMVSVPLFAALV